MPDELAFILADAGATTIVFGSEFADVVAELHGRGDETALATFIEVAAPGRRRPAPDWAQDYAALQAGAPSDEITVETEPDDLLYIMYTSGTTGLPKGVMHSHSTAIWAILTIDATADLHFADRYLVALPLYHVGALTPAVGACLRAASRRS